MRGAGLMKKQNTSEKCSPYKETNRLIRSAESYEKSRNLMRKEDISERNGLNLSNDFALQTEKGRL